MGVGFGVGVAIGVAVGFMVAVGVGLGVGVGVIVGVGVGVMAGVGVGFSVALGRASSSGPASDFGSIAVGSGVWGMPAVLASVIAASFIIGTGVTTASLAAMIISTYLSFPAQPHTAALQNASSKTKPTARRVNIAYRIFLFLLCLQRIMQYRSE